jgi:hypothetical protein
MHEMAAVHPRLVTQEYGMETKGDRSLEPRIENGVKVFNLEVSVIRWHILPKVAVDAFAYNGQIPGLRIRVTQGDHLRIIVHTRLPESTTVYWHGLVLPNKMDGPAFITQDPDSQRGLLLLRIHRRPKQGRSFITATTIQTGSRVSVFTEPSSLIHGKEEETNRRPTLHM